MTIPAGWAAHPDNPQYMYNTMNPAEVVAIPVAAPAAVAAPAVAAPGGDPSLYAAPADLGAQNVEEGVEDYKDGQKRMSGGGTDYLDFQKLENVNDEDMLNIRVMPPWKQGITKSFVTGTYYRIPGNLVPDTDKQFGFPLSFNHPQGPGNDPIEAALVRLKESGNEQSVKAAKDMRGKTRHFFQVANLDDINGHWVQEKDSAGNAVLDPTGQPKYAMLPKIFACGPKLKQSIQRYLKTQGDYSSYVSGYGHLCTKTKTGPANMDVEYDAVPLAAGQLPQELMPMLHSLYDLNEKMLRFNTREQQEAIANNILLAHGIPVQQATAPMPTGHMPAPIAAPLPVAVEQWVTHPENGAYEYLPSTGATRPKEVAAPVPVVPPAPMPVPAALPAAPAHVAAPLAVPLPPPVAPGLPVGALPPAAVVAPVGPPVASPGLPPGVVPAVMAPGALAGQLQSPPAAPGMPQAAPPGALPPMPPPPPGNDDIPF